MSREIPPQDKHNMLELNRVAQLFADTIAHTFNTQDIVVSFGYITPNGIICTKCLIAPEAKDIDMIIFQMTWSIYQSINNNGLQNLSF